MGTPVSRPFSHALDAPRPSRGIAMPNVRRDLALSVRSEWLPFAGLAPVTDAWRALAARALEPNVFYGPAFALPAATAFGKDTGALLVWSRTGARRLIGFWPVVAMRRRWGVPLPVLVGWTHPYAPLGTPLVDADQAELALEALLAHVRADPTLPKLLLVPQLPDGPVAARLAEAVVRHGGRSADFDVHARALLAPTDDRAGYLDRAVGRKKAKELKRLRRRLDEAGPVRLVTAHEPAEVASALGAFFRLESQGWKGRAGTAAVQHKEAWTFMQSALAGLAATRDVRIDRLVRGEETLAAAITLKQRDTSWFWKIAYDEDAARFSPGVQLTLEVTEALLADAALARVDSCAVADHSMIDHLWRERLPLADRLVAPDAAASVLFGFARQLESARRTAVAGARRLRALLP